MHLECAVGANNRIGLTITDSESLHTVYIMSAPSINAGGFMFNRVGGHNCNLGYIWDIDSIPIKEDNCCQQQFTKIG